MNEAFKLQSEVQKKRKKTFRRVLFWIKFLLTVGLLITTIIFTALSPLFNIKAIEVNGSKHYDRETLEGLSGIHIGENGFKSIGSSPANIVMLRFGNAEKNIREKCPYIKEVTVRYAIPSRVVMDVVERAVSAAVPYLGTSLVIDRDGYVLETASGEKIKGLPVVKGLKFEQYELGGKLVLEDKESLVSAGKVMDAVKESDLKETPRLFEKVDAIDVSDVQRVLLFLDSRLTVNLGDLQDLNYRISMVKTVFDKNIKKDDKGVLDFTLGRQPVFTPEK